MDGDVDKNAKNPSEIRLRETIYSDSENGDPATPAHEISEGGDPDTPKHETIYSDVEHDDPQGHSQGAKTEEGDDGDNTAGEAADVDGQGLGVTNEAFEKDEIVEGDDDVTKEGQQQGNEDEDEQQEDDEEEEAAGSHDDVDRSENEEGDDGSVVELGEDNAEFSDEPGPSEEEDEEEVVDEYSRDIDVPDDLNDLNEEPDPDLAVEEDISEEDDDEKSCFDDARLELNETVEEVGMQGAVDVGERAPDAIEVEEGDIKTGEGEGEAGPSQNSPSLQTQISKCCNKTKNMVLHYFTQTVGFTKVPGR